MVECPALHQALQDWLQAMLARLPQMPLQLTSGYSVTFTPDGSGYQAGPTPPRPDYSFTLLRQYDDVVSLPESNTVLQLITSSQSLSSTLLVDAGGNRIIDQAGQLNWLFNFVFQRFFYQYFSLHPAPDFEQSPFDAVYKLLEDYVDPAIPLRVTWLIGLVNVHMSGAPVRLNSTMGIRQATTEERERIITQAFEIGDRMRTHAPSTFLEIRDKYPKIPTVEEQRSAFNKSLRASRDTLLTIRLFDPSFDGRFGIDRMNLGTQQPFARTIGGSYGQPMFYSALPGTAITISDADSTVVSRLFSMIRKSARSTGLSTPITRLEDADTRMKVEDRLLDYWVALEALFLPPDLDRDITQAIALAAAHYVGKHSKERQQLYDDLKVSYAWRSHLIHGQRGTPPRVGVDAVTKTTGHILRRALRKRVEE